MRKLKQLRTEVKNPSRKRGVKYDWVEMNFAPGLYLVEIEEEEIPEILRENLTPEQLSKVKPQVTTRISKVDTRDRLQTLGFIDEEHKGHSALLEALGDIDPEFNADALLIEADVNCESFSLEILRELVNSGVLSPEQLLTAAAKVTA
jgi:protein involved in temperature-dependent protein secretion